MKFHCQPSPKHIIVVIIYLLVVAATIYIVIKKHQIMSNHSNLHRTGHTQCFLLKGNTLPDISENEPPKGKSIFFIDTSCTSYINGKLTINARQACAVESAARLNPNLQIQLLFASPGTFDFEGTESDRFVRALLSYPNFKMHHVDFEKYAKGTPIEETQKFVHSTEHAGEVLRFLTLWKFGGIYLDLDVIVLKSLEHLPLNFAAGAVVSFSPDGPGHEWAQNCLYYLNGTVWDYDGPGVTTRLLQTLCGAEGCQGFKVFPEEAFYPVAGNQSSILFDEGAGREVFEVLNNSYVVHMWNELNFRRKIPIASEAPYLLLARKFCPKVVRECDYWW